MSEAELMLFKIHFGIEALEMVIEPEGANT